MLEVQTPIQTRFPSLGGSSSRASLDPLLGLCPELDLWPGLRSCRLHREKQVREAPPWEDTKTAVYGGHEIKAGTRNWELNQKPQKNCAYSALGGCAACFQRRAVSDWPEKKFQKD